MTASPLLPVPEQFLFITPVWGEQYVERYIKVSLPSQLSAGNLGAIPPGRGHYLIYTLREHARTIVRSRAFRRLKQIIPTTVKSLDDLPDPRLNKNPHELQTAAYQRGIRFGAGRDSAFVFLTPDILLSDGTLASTVRLAESGKRVQLVAGIRMLTEGAVSCVVRHRSDCSADAAIPPRELVRSLLDNLHPISRGHIVMGGRVLAPQHLYWPIGTHGLLARGFHLHPLLVWPRTPDALIRNTLDDEYVSRACPDRADWHVVTDSDEMCVIEFSERNHKPGMIAAHALSDEQIRAFMCYGTTPDHRDHARHCIRFHAGRVDDAEWSAAELNSDELVAHYLALYAQGMPRDVGASGVSDRIAGGAAAVSLKRILSLALLPVRVLNRLVNYKLYRYVDRLNAELRTVNDRLRNCEFQVTHVSKLHEELARMVAAHCEEEELAAASQAREFARIMQRKAG